MTGKARPRCRYAQEEGERRRGVDVDRERPIYRLSDKGPKVKGERRDFESGELASWLARGGKCYVGLFPSTAGVVMVDFDSGGDSMRAWVDSVLGEPLAVMTSSGGRGIHAWYRRAEGVSASKGKVDFVLPGLRGPEAVRGEVFFHGGPACLAGPDDVRRLVLAMRAKRSSSCALTREAVRVLTMPMISGVLSECVSMPSGARHGSFLALVGSVYQEDMRSCRPEGAIARALVECASQAVGADDFRGEAESIVRDVLRQRNAEASSAVSVDEGVDRVELSPNVDGFTEVVAREDWRIGETRLGRPRLMVSVKGGEWESLGRARQEWMRGVIARGYGYHTKETRKAGAPVREWMVSRTSMEAYLRAQAMVEIDPFRDYLGSLPEVRYDARARERLDLMPWEVWEFGETDADVVRFAFRSMMCAAVIRNARPGAKHDHVVVLQGPQGIGKSTFVRSLLPGSSSYRPLFGRCNLALLNEQGGDRRLMESVNGKVFAEIPEMKGVGKIEAVKDFISAQEDEFRWVYDSETAQIGRTAVLVATTNLDESIMSDPSGNRRFVPVVLTGLREGVLSDDRNPYRGVWRVMDGGLRDEWWSLAKAAVAHEMARLGEAHSDVWAEGVGNELTVAPDWLVDRLNENSRLHERTSVLGDLVEQMMTGLALSDSMGGAPHQWSYVLDVIPADAMHEALGLEAGSKAAADVGRLKSLMPRYGYHHRIERYHLGAGDRVVRQSAYARREGRVRGRYPRYDRARLVGVLKDALESGVPLSNEQAASVETDAGP